MKPVHYFLIAITSFFTMCILLAPATIAWRLTEDKIHVPGLEVYGISGSIWNGSATVRYQQFPPSNLSWKLSPRGLIAGKINIDTSISGDGHNLAVNAIFSSSQIMFESVTGTIHSRYINSLSTNLGVKLSGELTISTLSLTAKQEWFTHANGRFSWNGGEVYLPRGNPLGLPAMDGTLSLRRGDLFVEIKKDSSILAQLELDSLGWARVNIRRPMFELANLPVPENAASDETLLQLEEKIL